jgi:hypothetical protein
MLTDAAAIALALVAARIARRQARVQRGGLGRAEILSARFTGATELDARLLTVYEGSAGATAWNEARPLETAERRRFLRDGKGGGARALLPRPTQAPAASQPRSCSCLQVKTTALLRRSRLAL